LNKTENIDLEIKGNSFLIIIEKLITKKEPEFKKYGSIYSILLK